MKPHLKVCDRCEVAKPATETYFGINLRTKDHLKPYCRACGPAVILERRKRKNELSKAWYAANLEKARERARESRARNPKDRRAYFRRYRQENKEKLNAQTRAYAQRKRQESASD